MRAALRHPLLQLSLATAILYTLLVLPNHPSALTPQAFMTFPLELPALLLLMSVLQPSRMTLVIRALLSGLLVLIVILKGADFAMFSALSRGFNPVADLPLIQAGLHLLASTWGGLPTALATIAAIGSVCLTLALVWWSLGVWVAKSPSGMLNGLPLVMASVVAVGLALSDVSHHKGWKLPFIPAFNPPGTAFTARVGVERALLVRDTIADLKVFRAAAANDPFAETTGLLDQIDRDVLIVFIESYGRTSFDTPLFADLHPATLAAGEARLAQKGLAMASGFLASPTQGGQSWLAHSTFANGLWISDQTRYRAALVSGRQTLTHIAARSGFETAAVMPQITMDWPESAFMGYDKVLAAKDLGYKGLPFNWVTMPDQFTFAAMDRLVRDLPGDRPHFIVTATGSSHAPWVPVPRIVPWDKLGDGQIFNDMAKEGDPPDVVWRDRDRVRAQYRLAIDYALQNVLSYAERHADNPPLMIILGDHQAAGFVAMDERIDVPVHVIGPADLVAKTAAWAPYPGLIPPAESTAIKMDKMRDLFLRAFSSGLDPKVQE